MPRAIVGCGLLALGLVASLVAPARAAAPCPVFQVDAPTRFGLFNPIPVTLWPPSGPAPLTVGVLWNARPSETPRAVEIDADGDGKPDTLEERGKDLAYTYPRPGQFAATIRVVDAAGHAVTYAAPVTVFSAAAFETELQARWASLKAALERSEPLVAIECVDLMARQRLQHAVVALAGRSDLESLLPPIRFLRFDVAEAIFEMTLSGVKHEIKFQPDWDGIWRLKTLY
jgi:hypothetical protein